MIRQVASIAASVAFLLSAASTPARASDTTAERIDDYNVVLTIAPGGRLHVAERIRYTFAPGRGRHGIERRIPERVRYDGRHDRVLRLSGFRVAGPPGPAGALAGHEDDGTEKLRIGDPHRTVTGTQTYAIDYDVDRALTRDASGIVLTWNAIGTDWNVPITRADVTVRSPVPIQGVTCAAGAEHDTAPCARATSAGTGTAPRATFAATALPDHAGLTVRVRLPRGSVPVSPPRLLALTKPFAVTRFTTAGIGTAAGLLLIAAWWFLPHRRRGRARGDGGPPDGPRVPPGPAALVVNGLGAERPALAATLVDLAVRGHIRLEAYRPTREEKLIRAIRGEAAEEDLLDVERRFLDMVFRTHRTAPVHMLWTHAPLQPMSESLERALVELGWYRRSQRAQAVQGTAAAWSAGIVGVLLFALSFAASSFAGAGWVSLTALVIVPALAVMGRYAVPRRAAGARAEAAADAWRTTVMGGPPRDDVTALSRTFPYALAFGRAHAWPEALAPWALRGELDWFTVVEHGRGRRRRRERETEQTVAPWINSLGATWARRTPLRGTAGRPGRSSGHGGNTGFHPLDSSGGGGGMSVGEGGGGGGGGSW
ncbi:DUF2207 domain-containing protein [Actinoallomurus iriomotensis]|uniref:Membrane protein DUF2207 n=1 Tax=Actinoallomurus iriomotensis TaxID=478107 RepID=A0A9W6W2B0_9ACTN|nr:DUF2207 domain-containing protein [Actinoallomurus iriomotensis]GLY86766.1 hypothetical protein Airi02_046950 [Actinoallomurus iriomotensis]